jgi:hypothetical protein
MLGRLVIAAVSMWPLASFAGGLAEMAAKIDHPTLGTPISIERPLQIGRAAIEPGAAATVRELLAGDEKCGVAVEGPATFRLVIDDPFSAPIAERNLDRASKLKARKRGGRFEVEFEVDSAIVWWWEAPASADGGAAPPASGGLPEWAAEVLTDPLFAPPSVALIAARGVAADGVVYALMDSDKGTYLYTTDPVDNRIEELSHVDRVKSSDSVHRGRHFLERLVTQPLGRAWWDRAPRPLVATHSEIGIVNDAASHISVSTKVDLLAMRPTVGIWRSSLRERLISATNKELPNTVTSVRVNGRPADFVQLGSQLLIAVDPPAEAGATTRIEVANQGNLAIRPGNGKSWTLGTWAWHPDPGLNGDMSTSIITLEVPKDQVPFASGTMVSMTTGETSTVLTTKLDRPMQFVVAAAGSYHLSSDTRKGLTCSVGSYLFGKEKAAERLIDLFFAAEDFYSQLFASPYPFREVDIVEVNDWGFGQAPPGIIFITQEAFEPKTDVMNQFFSKGVNERFVHEIAHAWWGHVVKMDSLEEQWLSESFSEYSAALCIQALAGGGKKGQREFDEILKGWRVRAKEVGRGASVYLANYLAGEDRTDALDRYYLLYDKGPLVIHGIRVRLASMYGPEEGDKVFVALLQGVLANFTFKWGGTRHLVGILNQLTGENWQPWFERYVYGCEMPDIG